MAASPPNARMLKMAEKFMTAEQKQVIRDMQDPEVQAQKMEEARLLMESQKNFFLIHPHQSLHVTGPSPVATPPEPTKAPQNLSMKIGGKYMQGLIADMSGPSMGSQVPPGDLSHSYPVSYTFEFPTRFIVTQKLNYLDMTVQDEYGNPILCFHAYQWFFKRKLRMIDLRTGQPCGKIVEELKALTGKYKFNVYLDDKDKKFGSITKLGLTETPHMAALHFKVRTAAGEVKVIDHLLGKPIAVPTPQNQEVAAGSFFYTVIHNRLVDGDVYYLDVSPGTDIRLMAAIVVAFDKFTTSY